MSVKVNIDNFSIGPQSRAEEWESIRRFPDDYAKNRKEWYYYAEKCEVPAFPLHVDFETSTTCNMNCPMCWRNHGDYDPSHFGVMNLDLYKKGIDECVKYGLYSIRLSWKGECLTNPDFVEMIQYAKDEGIKEVSFITNGYKLEGQLAEDIVRAGVDYITVSVDGLQKEYDVIRAPATFDGIVANLKNLRRLRDAVGGGFPRIRINSVWNESKGEVWFEKMYDYFKDIVDYMTFTPEYSHDGKAKELRPDFTCQYPFQRITIMWDGKIPLCISDKGCLFQIGDLSKESIYDIWHGEKMNKARELNRDHQAHEIACCNICDRAVTKQVGHIEVKQGK